LYYEEKTLLYYSRNSNGYLTSGLEHAVKVGLLHSKKSSHKFIVAILVRHPWWKGLLLNRAKGLFR